MLAETRIELEARNPTANPLRRWGIDLSTDLSQDLLGMWVVDVEFGQIGLTGRRLRDVFVDQHAAQSFVGRGLRRRSNALARIGVAYRCVRSSVEARDLLAMFASTFLAPQRANDP
jgi:hypothetical protein